MDSISNMGPGHIWILDDISKVPEDMEEETCKEIWNCVASKGDILVWENSLEHREIDHEMEIHYIKCDMEVNEVDFEKWTSPEIIPSNGVKNVTSIRQEVARRMVVNY